MVLTMFHLPERSRAVFSALCSGLTGAGAGTACAGLVFATSDSGVCTGEGRDGDSALATSAGEVRSRNLYIRTAAAAMTAIAKTANASAVRSENREACGGGGLGTSAVLTSLLTIVTSSVVSGTIATGAASSGQ